MDQSSKIVLLFDYFSMESRNLYESFTNVGIPFTAAVVEFSINTTTSSSNSPWSKQR